MMTEQGICQRCGRPGALGSSGVCFMCVGHGCDDEAIIEGVPPADNTPCKLRFDVLRESNVRRSSEAFPQCEEWSASDWAMALTGELGELLNLLKKRKRGEHIPDEAISHEFGDVQIYLDLLAYHVGVDLGLATIQKFNLISSKKKCGIFLEDP